MNKKRGGFYLKTLLFTLFSRLIILMQNRVLSRLISHVLKLNNIHLKAKKSPKRLTKGLFLRYKTKKVLITLYQNLCSLMVPVAGLEPARFYPLDFESSLSTISTHRQLNNINFTIISTKYKFKCEL